jgi:hypothetical protein
MRLALSISSFPLTTLCGAIIECVSSKAINSLSNEGNNNSEEVN